MRNSKLNYVVVGIFVLAMLSSLIISIAMLSGRTGATDKYFAIYRNVTGLKFGSQVLYEGFPIGQVEQVTPVAQGAMMSFRVDFSVIEGWLIPEDSIAKLAAPGLLSAMTLSLSAGQSAQALQPNSQVIAQEATNAMDMISSLADQTSSFAEQDIRPLIAKISPLLDSLTKTSDSLGVVVADAGGTLIPDLQDLTGDLVERIPKITDDVEQIVMRLEGSSIELDALLNSKNRKKIEALIENMDKTSTNFADLSRNMDVRLKDMSLNVNSLIKDVNSVVTDNQTKISESVADARYVAGSLARHIDALNQNMEAMSRNMYEFSRQIRLNPGLLLGGTPPRDEAKQ